MKTRIPKSFKPAGHRRLAEGEATGHYHEAVAEDVRLWINENDEMIAEMPSGSEIVHQEHAAFSVPAGTYDRSIVQTFDYEEMESRNVAD